MNRTLLSAIILLTALPAAAEVELYGRIQSGIESSSTRFGGQTHSRTAIADQGSRIGLRGSHPIGGGTSFIWQTEQSTPVGQYGRRTSDYNTGRHAPYRSEAAYRAAQSGSENANR